jgi:putative transposase
MEELLPWLYLKGLSTGDFQEALDKKRYVYFWADGVYFNIRGDEARQCILVIVGVDEHGHKEFVAIEDGYRESEQSWLEVLSSLKQRGLQVGPKLAVGDGALGFWKALAKVYGETRHQRCWVHKTVNVLNKLPKGAQAKAKAALHQIWMAATREDAYKPFDGFLATYRDKYLKAAGCMEKDREMLLAFYDSPAAHWQHIRTSNPIESTFATGLGQSAIKRWRRLRGFKHLADVIRGVKFENGVRVDTNDSRVAA